MEELGYLFVNTVQVSFESNLRPWLSRSPQLLLIDRFLPVGVIQGVSWSQALVCYVCSVMPCSQGMGPREPRADIQPPEPASCVCV